MRKLCCVLTALVVSGATFAASAETQTAEERADIALVEEEIQAVDESIAIHKRAKERARKAVDRSSLGRECRKASGEAAAARKRLKASRAHREYLGKDKITDQRAYAKSIGATTYGEGQVRYLDEIDRRRKAYDKAVKEPELLSKLASLCHKRYALFVKRMVRIFLTDEIERAEEKKLDGLMRELKKIRKKDYAHI